MAANQKMRAWLERSIEELTSGDWLEATGKRQEVPGSDPTSPSQTTRHSVPYPPGPPMTLGNMRELGVGSLAVTHIATLEIPPSFLCDRPASKCAALAKTRPKAVLGMA